jgi:hypothetical protein
MTTTIYDEIREQAGRITVPAAESDGRTSDTPHGPAAGREQ